MSAEVERAGPDRDTWTQVAPPLSGGGNTVNPVIAVLCREARQVGIASTVIAGVGLGDMWPGSEVRVVQYPPALTRYPGVRAQVGDASRGRLGLSRRLPPRLYTPIGVALNGGEGPVVVHDGFHGAAGLPTLRLRAPGRRIVLWVHNALSRTYTRRELRRWIDCADATICVSDAVRGRLAERLGRSPVTSRLWTVLNGVDSEQFRPRAELRASRPRILFVGMMRAFKGPDMLLDALLLLRDQGLDFDATFVGSTSHAVGVPLSEYEQALRRRAEALGPLVAFASYVPHALLPRIFQRHDILVVPSRFEDPCPLTVLEGMASGLAVVATRRGGIPEIGADAVQYAADAAGIATILARLLADDDERGAWAEASRRRALDLSWAKTLERARAIIWDA